MAPVVAFIARAGEGVGHGPQPVFATLSREQVFVLSRSAMGAIRAAVLEEQSFVKSRAFEDEIVRMIVAYLGAITNARDAAAGRDPNRTTS